MLITKLLEPFRDTHIITINSHELPVTLEANDKNFFIDGYFGHKTKVVNELVWFIEDGSFIRPDEIRMHLPKFNGNYWKPEFYVEYDTGRWEAKRLLLMRTLDRQIAVELTSWFNRMNFMGYLFGNLRLAKISDGEKTNVYYFRWKDEYAKTKQGT